MCHSSTVHTRNLAAVKAMAALAILAFAMGSAGTAQSPSHCTPASASPADSARFQCQLEGGPKAARVHIHGGCTGRLVRERATGRLGVVRSSRSAGAGSRSPAGTTAGTAAGPRRQRLLAARRRRRCTGFMNAGRARAAE